MKNTTVTIWFRGDLKVLSSVLNSLEIKTHGCKKDMDKGDLLHFVFEQPNCILVNIPIETYLKFRELYHNIKD